jgi:hypothetical protein
MRRLRARRPARQADAGRDQHESAFTAILGSLVARVAGARAVALVDRDGETVDYAGRLDPFALKVAAAHWRIVLDETKTQPSLHDARWLALRAGRVSFLIHELPEGYAIVLQLTRAAGFAEWRRALSACAHSLAREAGWPAWPNAWFPVQVETDARRRPLAVSAGAQAGKVEILGALAGGFSSRERGWRVRFPSGVEATLVREPGGHWYSDEPVEPAPGHRSLRPEQSR